MKTSLLVFIFFLFFSCSNGEKKEKQPKPTKLSIVEKHGQLQVVEGTLYDKNKQPMALHGMSFGWHNWWPRFYNHGAVKELKDNFGCTVLRAAMGVNPNPDNTKLGYLNNPAAATSTILTVVNACIEEGIYVIIDWHSHEIYEKEAIEFFDKMSKIYANYPNVIYEIFNEPKDNSWQEIKEYSIKVINTIRKNDTDNLILVGTPKWSSDAMAAVKDPIVGQSNILYTVHFYAASHNKYARENFKAAKDKNLPIFISECAGMEYTGDGIIDKVEWNNWIKLLDETNTSWIAWSVADKDETCSILLKTASSNGSWSDTEIKEWGKIIREDIKKYNKKYQ